MTNVFPDAKRPIDEALWLRSAAFSALFGGNKIRQVSIGGIPYYCANARSDPDDDNVQHRPVLSQKEAAATAKLYVAQLGGADSTIDELRSFSGSEGKRVISCIGGTTTCSCPAFYHPRRCFHTLGLSLKLGLIEIPEGLDPTPVG